MAESSLAWVVFPSVMFGCSDRSVNFRAAIGEAMDLVLIGNANDMFPARAAQVEIGVDDGFLFRGSFCQDAAIGVADFAFSNKAEASFRADAIDARVKDGVFHRPRVDHKFRHALGTWGEVGRQENDFGASQGHHAGGFWKCPVVADVHANLRATCREHAEALVAEFLNVVYESHI